MTGFDGMDASELRAELDEARELAFRAAEDLVNAVEAGDWDRVAALAMCATRPALARVRRLRRALTLGIAG